MEPGRAPLPPPSASASAFTRLRAWYGRHRVEVALVVLSITIAELLTGSTPVLSLWNPFAVAGLLGLYGAGVLLIREASIVWRGGWATVLLLGLAYGIAEEGVATKTMVDPHAGAIGFLGTYGHALGVNWVFAVVIALFHALFSIALPILLVELIYPRSRGQRLLSPAAVRNCLLAFSATVVFGYLAFDPHYWPGVSVLAFFAGAMAVFVLAARYVPSSLLLPRTQYPARSPRALLGVGIAGSFGWSFLYLIGPHLIPVPAVVIALQLVVLAALLALAVRWVGRERGERQRLYLAIGLLSWYFVWIPIVILLEADYLVIGVFALVGALLWRLSARWPEAPPRTPESSVTYLSPPRLAG